MKEIALVGFVQSIFFALLIILKKKKQWKDIFLFIFFLLVGCELIYRYLQFSPISNTNKWLAGFDIVYWALLGPIVFLYIQFTIDAHKEPKPKDAVHIIPLIIGMVPLIQFLTLSGNVDFIDYYHSIKGFPMICIYIWEFSSACYLLVSLIILIYHQKQIKSYYSNLAKRNLKWMFFLTSGFASYIYSSYLYWAAQAIFDLNSSFKFIEIIVPILTLYVFGMGIFGYKQEGIFFDSPLPNHNHSKEKNRYIKSGLRQSEELELNKKLQELMLEEKRYLDSEINISNLAREMDTSIHKLSQLINKSYQKNFYDFINSYRIKDVKDMLTDPDLRMEKVMSLAYDCGFNSRSTFYAFFKKETGMTPTQFREKYMMDEAMILK